jgi:hypothetical protein
LVLYKLQIEIIPLFTAKEKPKLLN